MLQHHYTRSFVDNLMNVLSFLLSHLSYLNIKPHYGGDDEPDEEYKEKKRIDRTEKTRQETEQA